MAAPIASLRDAFAQFDDPRKPGGIHHPFTSLLSLPLLGLLCRETDFAGLQRWAGDHWRTLKGPLGFTQKAPPHATTISRALVRFSLKQYRDAAERPPTPRPARKRGGDSPPQAPDPGRLDVDYIREVTAFPGLAMILRVDTEARVLAGPIRHEPRYQVTSLSPEAVSPRQLIKLIWGHWSVENILHFIKDRWWDEDRQWSTRPGLAERLAMLRDSALRALRVLPEVLEDLLIRARADHLGRKLRKALRFIGALDKRLCNPPGSWAPPSTGNGTC